MSDRHTETGDRDAEIGDRDQPKRAIAMFRNERSRCSETRSKRLCGKIGGGSNDDEYSSGNSDASASQWYRVCSSGGVNAFPYGNSFEPTFCNIYGCWGNVDEESLPVATLSTYQSSVPGYSGVYDMSGNVFEWVDSCSPSGRACRTRGGAFDSWSTSGYAGCLTDVLACDSGWSDTLDVARSDLGFRCCSP